MGSKHVVLLLLIFSLCCKAGKPETATLGVDASSSLARKILETLFGVFFEVR
jgi:hypothetical protein